jgi:hypothetical protein
MAPAHFRFSKEIAGPDRRERDGIAMSRFRLLGTCVLLAAMLGAAGVPAPADETHELTWDDLIPASANFEDPFEQLEREQLEYLGFVARVRAMLDAGTEIGDSTRQELAETEAELIADGIDVDDLLDRRDEFREWRRKRAEAVVEELDETQVRLSGYMLPLEPSGGRTTEFLLIPWVVECIHTPPPPPNQIVHVVLEPGDSIGSHSAHEPVLVSGILSTQRSTQNLFLADGSTDLDVRYQVRAGRIEVFRP